jgi:XTP/dITP diphosphohydrolase
MNRLVLATHNKHKAEELSALLSGAAIEILMLDSFPHIEDIVEDQPTLAGNALKKAREVFLQTNLPSLADDTGLEVFALDGAPGVYSARYAGEKATYADNCRKLLESLRGVPMHRRTAQFRCVLAFVPLYESSLRPGGGERVVEGVCAGTIIETPRGANGFGYDPIFLPNGYSQTFAEMSLDLKNTLSHRANALMGMKRVLLEYFGA